MFARESNDQDSTKEEGKAPKSASNLTTSTGTTDKPSTPSRPFEKDVQRCEDAKNNLAQLSRTFRIRYTDENGKQRLLSAEEKQKQRQAALKAIEESC
jgi:hypothetical protein